MGNFDGTVVEGMSALSGHHPVLDFIFLTLGESYTFKLVPLIAGLFLVWSRDMVGRRQATVGAIGTFAALILARIIQNFGPHRVRPISSPLFHFPGAARNTIVDWSSFPSDTTALACALATSIFFASRKFGLLAFAWAALVAIAKLYGGYHYPTDVVVGALIGIAATMITHRSTIMMNWIFARLEVQRTRRPGLMAAVAFLAAFQLATFFNDVRVAAKAIHGQGSVAGRSTITYPLPAGAHQVR